MKNDIAWKSIWGLICFVSLSLLSCESNDKPHQLYPEMWRNNPDFIPTQDSGVLSKIHFGMGYLDFLKAVDYQVDDKDYYEYYYREDSPDEFEVDVTGDFVFGGCKKKYFTAYFKNRVLSKIDFGFRTEYVVDDLFHSGYGPWKDEYDFPIYHYLEKPLFGISYVIDHSDQWRDSLLSHYDKAIYASYADGRNWYSDHQIMNLCALGGCGTHGGYNQWGYRYDSSVHVLTIKPYTETKDYPRVFLNPALYNPLYFSRYRYFDSYKNNWYEPWLYL